MNKKLHILLIFSNFVVEIKSKSQENHMYNFCQNSDKFLTFANAIPKIWSTRRGMFHGWESSRAFPTLKSSL